MEITHRQIGHNRQRRRLSCAGFTLIESNYEPGARMPDHADGETKISLVVSGSTRETGSREENDCAAGSVVTKPADARHSNLFGPLGMRAFSVYPQPTMGKSSIGEYRWRHGGPVARIMFRLYDLFQSASESSNPEGLDESLYTLEDALVNNCFAGFSRQVPRWLDDVVEILHAQYRERLRVDAVARSVDAHPVYVARVFRRRHGCTMTDYLHRLRVRHAAGLLANTDQPFARIALDVGFADQPHFCRAFKAQWGITPGRYRVLARSN